MAGVIMADRDEAAARNGAGSLPSSVAAVPPRSGGA